jgi:hypothetical protein
LSEQYYVHQHGRVYRHPNVRFRDSAGKVSQGNGDLKIQADVESEGDVKKNGNVENQAGTESEGQEKSSRNVKSEVAKAFCGDDRLTVMRVRFNSLNNLRADDYRHFPLVPKPIKGHLAEPISSRSEVLSEALQEILPADMPDLFKEKLENICPYCHCKKEILWNNLRREEQHFDACFRYVNKPKTSNRKCFLKRMLLQAHFYGTHNRTNE